MFVFFYTLHIFNCFMYKNVIVLITVVLSTVKNKNTLS